jgi:hypothetical protein
VIRAPYHQGVETFSHADPDRLTSSIRQRWLPRRSMAKPAQQFEPLPGSMRADTWLEFLGSSDTKPSGFEGFFCNETQD